jgi:hypothetical protein
VVSHQPCPAAVFSTALRLEASLAYQAVVYLQAVGGESPTRDDVAALLGFSTARTNDAVSECLQHGWLSEGRRGPAVVLSPAEPAQESLAEAERSLARRWDAVVASRAGDKSTATRGRLQAVKARENADRARKAARAARTPAGRSRQEKHESYQRRLEKTRARRAAEAEAAQPERRSAVAEQAPVAPRRVIRRPRPLPRPKYLAD